MRVKRESGENPERCSHCERELVVRTDILICSEPLEIQAARMEAPGTGKEQEAENKVRRPACV